jgi:hypothetical protein
MYNIYDDLQLKPREKITTYINPNEEANQKIEKIKNKYNKLYQPSKDLQIRI